MLQDQMVADIPESLYADTSNQAPTCQGWTIAQPSADQCQCTCEEIFLCAGMKYFLTRKIILE